LEGGHHVHVTTLVHTQWICVVVVHAISTPIRAKTSCDDLPPMTQRRRTGASLYGRFKHSLQMGLVVELVLKTNPHAK
jgi:hypothetical protein